MQYAEENGWTMVKAGPRAHIYCPLRNRKTLIHLDREAKSLDEALRSAILNIQAEGWQAREISVEPDCVLPMSTG